MHIAIAGYDCPLYSFSDSV